MARAPVREGDVVADKYTIQRVLGRGGMAVVVAAYHRDLQERVAIKLLLREHLSDRTTVERFIREGRAAIRIKSEHVARVMDVSRLPTGEPYIVMEYLEGADLHRTVEEQGPLGLAESVDYVLMACEALAEAHALGIVHRDLKPANLFLTKRLDGSPCIKVLDFGISKLPFSAGGLDVTVTSEIVGSPSYMAPEQIAQAKSITPQADLWSIGAVLYKLLTGEPPFDGTSLPEIFQLVLHGEAPPLEDRCPGLPPRFVHVVTRCLEKELTLRYRTLPELAMDLAPFGTVAARRSAERIARTMPAAAAAANEASAESASGARMAGQVFAGRFRIRALAGTGGAGVVYRANDIEAGGAPVALKVLVAPLVDDDAAERFRREAELLAQLDDPAIVRHVAHGVSSGGPYLVTEWLEGCELTELLAGGARLSVADSITLAERVAGGLAAAHRAGIVHRDIKPSNLFLEGREVSRAKVLDFGIARLTLRPLTHPGHVVGTPGFMAPEQVLGEPDIDARADLFALGCVLYRCLAGREPFEAENAVAFYLKVALEEAPSLATLRPDLTPALVELVRDLLAKKRDERPQSADAVVERLWIIARASQAAPGALDLGHAVTRGLSDEEFRAMSVVVAYLGSDVHGAATPKGTIVTSIDTSVALAERAIADIGEQAIMLPDGTLVVPVGPPGTATDRARRAASCAAEILGAVATASVAIVSGRGKLSVSGVEGTFADRAVTMLSCSGAGEILVDAPTATLVGDVFRVQPVDEHGEFHRLFADRPSVHEPALPLVGRDMELGTLLAAATQALIDATPAVVTIFGEPGMGKTRLLQEVVSKLRASPSGWHLVTVDCDPARAGSPLSFLFRLLGAIGLGSSTESVSSLFAAREAPSDSALDAQADPRMVADRLDRALGEVLAARALRQPLAIVIDDVQWADSASLRALDRALCQLEDRPVLLLCFGREEQSPWVSGGWSVPRSQAMRLAPLARRAAERLLETVTPTPLGDEVVRALTDRAGGNPFFLVEIGRAASDTPMADLPETVLSMAATTLERVPSPRRRLLRAASVFGDVFWPAGVAAVLGPGEHAASVADGLAELARDRILVLRPEASPGEPEYAFRHSLLREAAYATLTDEDRKRAHLGAGEWTAVRALREPLVVARHFARGGDQARASKFFVKAARRALFVGDLVLALELLDEAERAGATGSALGVVRSLQALAYRWRGDYTRTFRCAHEAFTLIDRGSREWLSLVTLVGAAAGSTGDTELLRELGKYLGEAPAALRVTETWILSVARIAIVSLIAGEHDLADWCFKALEESGVSASRRVHDSLSHAMGIRAFFDGDLGQYLRTSRKGIEHFAATGDRLRWCVALTGAGVAEVEIGLFESAEATLHESVAAADKLGMNVYAAVGRRYQGILFAALDRTEEAEEVLRRTAQDSRKHGDLRSCGAAHANLAWVLARAGRPREAVDVANESLSLVRRFRSTRALAFAALAEARRRLGDVEGALAAARDGMQAFRALGKIETGELRLRLAEARALHDAGRTEDARFAIVAARAVIDRCASRLGDERWAKAYRDRVPECVEVRELEAAWRA